MKHSSANPSPLIVANRGDFADTIRRCVGTRLEARPYCIIGVANPARSKPNDPAFNFPPGLDDFVFTRAFVVFEGIPIDLEIIGIWRKWVMEHASCWDLKMGFLAETATPETFGALFEKSCLDWLTPPPTREAVGIEQGHFVKMPPVSTPKDHPSLLTMMFGKMGHLMSQIDVVARSFREAIKKTGFRAETKKQYLEAIDDLTSGRKGAAPSLNPFTGDASLAGRLPRVLLLGDSGVGKTLVASYLQAESGLKDQGPPLHISIPEYLGKEDMFEYHLFGYGMGDYTGGRVEGSHGLLLENVGGVVFFDEIGEANAELQAKLLKFFDDYRVRPRGWLNLPFFCPALVVAATNRNLEKMVAEKTFRSDLLARFTERYTIPALKDRKDDFPFILDCLLQNDSLNPRSRVKQIGVHALARLLERDFARGNFRELEDLFRAACQRASREGRDYLCRSDF